MSEPLFEFYVAGVKFHEFHICKDQITVGEHLILRSEPTNKFDPFAVKIECCIMEGNEPEVYMLGYVPMKDKMSQEVTLLLDSVVCRVVECNPNAETHRALKVVIEPKEVIIDEYEGEVENAS